VSGRRNAMRQERASRSTPGAEAAPEDRGHGRGQGRSSHVFATARRTPGVRRLLVLVIPGRGLIVLICSRGPAAVDRRSSRQ